MLGAFRQSLEIETSKTLVKNITFETDYFCCRSIHNNLTNNRIFCISLRVVELLQISQQTDPYAAYESRKLSSEIYKQ